MIVANIPSRYRVPAVEAVQHALRDAVTVEDARARVAHFDLATGRPRPAWYREERPDDAHGATLVSGAVLAWGPSRLGGSSTTNGPTNATTSA